MAHPTVKYFCIKQDGDYRMVRCWWYKPPRPADLEGSNPYYDDPNKFTVRFFDPNDPRDFPANLPKVTLETWTAPDCIFEDKQWGQWSSYVKIILENVTFINATPGVTDNWPYVDVEYHYEKITHLNHWEGETLYLSVPPREQWGRRPRPTPDDIKRHRGQDLYSIKPDVVVVNHER